MLSSSEPDVSVPMKCSNQMPTIGNSSRCPGARSKQQKSSTRGAVAPIELTVSLEKRLLDPDQLTDVQRCLAEATNDTVLLSDDKRIVEAKSSLLMSTSRYFEGVFRTKMQEAISGRIQTRISVAMLQLLVRFLECGQLSLDAENVEHVYVCAQYYQIDSLIDACESYLNSELVQLADVCLHLASMYDDMEQLGAAAAHFYSEHVREQRSTVVAFPGYLFAAVICRNSLRVLHEDEVVSLVVDWSRHQPRSLKERHQVLQYIRYPHLSAKGFRQVQQHFDIWRHVPLIQLCVENRFGELPEQQLTRRTFYADHLHLMWRESKDSMYQLCTERDPKMLFKLTCLRCSDVGVLSHSTIDTIPDIRNNNLRFQFVVVMNSLCFVTHSAKLNDIVVYRQRADGTWSTQVKIPRPSRLEEFAVCVYNGKIIVSMFAGFASTLQYIEVDVLKAKPNCYKVLDYVEPIKTYFSPTKMGFYDDLVIVLRDNDIKICDQHTSKCAVVWTQTPDVESGAALTARFVDFVRLDSWLYAYEDKVTINTAFRRTRGMFDKLYRINLDTKQLEETMEMRKPLYSSGRLHRAHMNHIRHLFTSGSKLMVAQQEAGNDMCSIAQVNSWGLEFSTLVDIRCSSTEPENTYHRHLVEKISTHAHRCEHETLLQTFCNRLEDAKQCHLLNRLTYYL